MRIKKGEMLKTNTKPKWLFLSPDELELFIKKTKFFLVALLCVAFGVEVVSGQTLKNLSKIRHKSKPSKKWLILFAAGTKSLERVWGWKTRTYDVPLWSIANQSNHHSFFKRRTSTRMLFYPRSLLWSAVQSFLFKKLVETCYSGLISSWRRRRKLFSCLNAAEFHYILENSVVLKQDRGLVTIFQRLLKTMKHHL